jgi:predicted nucleotidyltransferase
MMPIVEGFLAALDKIAVKFNLSIDIVGSFATGLWTHSSDINVSLVPRGN